MLRSAAIVLGGFVILAAGIATAGAGAVSVPNASFEAPATTFVSVYVDAWQKAPKPGWYDEGGGFLWEQLAGIFKNTPAGSSDHIDNCDGNQGLWLFAVPEVELFQDYDTQDWNDPAPSREFAAVFEPGKTLALTVGVIGGGGNMSEGATLEISLYYRDDQSNRVTVAAAAFTNSLTAFPSTTHLVDCTVRTARVLASDPWAGRHLGIGLRSTVEPALQGGYWDLDNVRLNAFSAPLLTQPRMVEGRFGFTLESEPGLRFDIQRSSQLGSSGDGWASLGTLTNAAGSVSFTDAEPAAGPRFYRARQVP